MRYFGRMTKTGLRELRQNASDLVRQAEAGEIVTITVSGREVAELGPVRGRRWRQWAEVQDVFRGPPDASWSRDRDTLDAGVGDPFAR